MKDDDFTHAAEIAHQRHFAERERLWDRTPEELGHLRHGEALLVEMILDAWRRRQERALAPLRMLAERLRAGPVDPDSELGQELAKIAEDPQGFSDGLDRNARMQGDLEYELGVAMVGTALALDGDTKLALKRLKKITGGRDWVGTYAELAKKHRAPVTAAEAEQGALAAYWAVVSKNAARQVKAFSEGRTPPTYENQRAALATAIYHEMLALLAPEMKEVAPAMPAGGADLSEPPEPEIPVRSLPDGLAYGDCAPGETAPLISYTPEQAIAIVALLEADQELSPADLRELRRAAGANTESPEPSEAPRSRAAARKAKSRTHAKLRHLLE